MCTHFIVFLQEENEIADMYTNFIVFLFQEENEIPNMCTNVMVFSGGE